MSAEYPFLNTIGVASINGVNPFLLIQLNKLGQQLGKPIEIYSGYRSSDYSANVGGFAGDPHSRGEAVDARIDGQEIGNVVPIQTLASLGLEGGNTPGFYPGHGDGGRDPGHVQIPNSGANKSMRSPTLSQATGNPASGNVPPATLLSYQTPSTSSSLYANLSHGQQTPARIVLHSTEGDAPPGSYGAGWEQTTDKLGAQIVVGRDGSIVRYVPDTQIAYGVSGHNTGTLDIEIVGHATNTRDQWRSNPQQLQTVAAVIAGWSKLYNIPIALSTGSGVSTHAMNAHFATKPSERHWDPGPGFPLGLVIAQARVFADQGKGLVPTQTVGQVTPPVTEIPNYRPGSAPTTTEIPNATDPQLATKIDQFLRSKGSPLAGQGATFVQAGAQNGVDPRLLVAISGGETSFATDPNAGKDITTGHNAWGMGPHIQYGSWQEGINATARNLGGYIARGLVSIPAISAKWAPIGAGNDPTNLNRNWVSTISQFYKELGGDPQAPVTQSPGASGGATFVSGAAPLGTTGTPPGPPPPAQPPYVPPPPPDLPVYKPPPPATPIVLLPAPPAGKPAAAAPPLHQGAPPPYDPANDRALAPAEPSGPLRRLYPVAKLNQAAAPTPAGGSGGPLRRLFPVSKLGRG